MITNKTKDKIAELAVKPIMKRLSDRAYEAVESFCKERCGKYHDVNEFCDEGKCVYKAFLYLLCEEYSKFN